MEKRAFMRYQDYKQNISIKSRRPLPSSSLPPLSSSLLQSSNSVPPPSSSLPPPSSSLSPSSSRPQSSNSVHPPYSRLPPPSSNLPPPSRSLLPPSRSRPPHSSPKPTNTRTPYSRYGACIGPDGYKLSTSELPIQPTITNQLPGDDEDEVMIIGIFLSFFPFTLVQCSSIIFFNIKIFMNLPELPTFFCPVGTL